MDERIIAYLSEQLSTEEKASLLSDAYQDEELKADLIAAHNTKALHKLYSSSTQQEEVEKRYVELCRKHRHQHWKHRLTSVMKYAAVFLLGILITSVVAYTFDKKMQGDRMQILDVPHGHRAHLTLPDGSKVWVNSGSRLSYPSVFDDERNVSLEGEALFEVAHDKNKKFVVHAKDVNVEALGTRFQISSYQGQTQRVSLLEGKVCVWKDGENPQKMLLKPQQQLVFGSSGVEILAMDSDTDSWTQGIISFTHAPISEIVQRLERCYDVKIKVKNPAILSVVYTGRFRQRDGVLGILHLIRKTQPFSIEHDEARREIVLY